MRVRVRLDVRYPLKRCKKLMISRRRAVKVRFKYEKLPIFCYICGRIGHMDRLCPKILQLKSENEDLPCEWNVELRVDMRRAGSGGDKSWLRDGQGGKVSEETSGDGDGENDGQLTLHGVLKETTVTGVFLASDKGNCSMMETSKHPEIGRGLTLQEESADLDLDLDQGEDHKRRRAVDSAIGSAIKDLLMKDVILIGLDSHSVDGGLSRGETNPPNNVPTAGLDIEARRQP